MMRRIGIMALIGLGVACVWAIALLVVGPAHNFGRSNFVAITAPAALIGRRMPMTVTWFILGNGVVYGAFGSLIELARAPFRHSLPERAA